LQSTSCEAAAAAYLAYEQGLFWEYHNRLFESDQEYSRPRLIEYAEEVGIPDIDEFTDHLDDEYVTRRLYFDVLEGAVADVSYTPTVLLNGRRLESYRREDDSWFELIRDTIEELIEERVISQ
jgi:protein-disulfide isomerase